MFSFPERNGLESKVPNVNAAKKLKLHYILWSQYTIITKGHVERKSSAKKTKKKLVSLFTHSEIVPNQHAII